MSKLIIVSNRLMRVDAFPMGIDGMLRDKIERLMLDRGAAGRVYGRVDSNHTA
jgi:hypothetical protein